MRLRYAWGAAGVLLLALLGCATHPQYPDFSSLSESPQNPSTPVQQEVVQTAVSLLGTPYRFGGMTPDGFDCSGFVNYVFRQAVGMTLPRESVEMVRVGKPVSSKNLIAADLVYFKIERQKFLHVGIYIGGGMFIHAPSSRGKVNVQSLELDYWKKRYFGARRII